MPRAARDDDTGLGAFHHVAVGVTDLEAAVAFWSGHFELTTRSRRDGADPGLAAVWGLPPDGIRRQAVLATPGARVGALHLVEFTAPAAPVRAGAAVHDRLPKNLDLYTSNIDERAAELAAAGLALRSAPAEIRAGGRVFKEVHLAGHDELNVVLLDVPDLDLGAALQGRRYAGVGPLVAIVGDVTAESRFYRSVLGMGETLSLQLGGAQIEQTVGLPAGAVLDLRVFGDPEEPLGRLEIIEYQGTRGADRYALAVPPARGILQVSYRVGDLAPLERRLTAAGVPVAHHGPVATPAGTGALIRFPSPAGLRIEVQAAAGAPR